MRIYNRIAAALGFTALVALALVLPAPTAHAAAPDFTIPTFEADYYLSRDSHRVSHMRVHEHIVARFPQTDQDHGIQRTLPRVYDGHRVSPHIQSVTDDSGHDIEYSQSLSEHGLIITLGSLINYVHDLQSYNIDYTLDNVTTHTASFDAQAWTVNGYNWDQQLGQVTVHIHLTSDLDGTIASRATRCTTGPEGTSAQACTVQVSTASEGETIITFTATRALEAGESLSYSLHFVPNTFATYQHSGSTQVSQTLYIAIVYVLPFFILLYVVVYFFIRRWQIPHLAYSTEIIVDAPLSWIIELYGKTKNALDWQPNLTLHQHISGVAGQPGAQSKLIYTQHKRSIEVTETIISRNFPVEFTVSYETHGIHNIVKSYFVEIDKTHTKWVVLDEFEFSGFQRLAAALRPAIFRRESLKYLENFKAFAEKGKKTPKNS